MESECRRLIVLSQRAESWSQYNEAEGLLNDAISKADQAECIECYELLAAFIRRRGRADEASVIEQLVGIMEWKRDDSLNEARE